MMMDGRKWSQERDKNVDFFIGVLYRQVQIEVSLPPSIKVKTTHSVVVLNFYTDR